MAHEIIRQPSPEEVEIEGKQAELAQLENDLAALQLELSTVDSDLSAFNGQYLGRLGSKFLILDELKAKFAQAYADRKPDDQARTNEASQAAEQARATAEEVGEYVRPDYQADPFTPTPDLKALFREVAKAAHPDLAVDDDDRRRREQFMGEANKAYKNSDMDRLQEILDAAELSRPVTQGEDLGKKLVRLIRMIASARHRLKTMRTEIAAVMESDMWQLKCEYEQEGEALFEDIEQKIGQEIKALEESIAQVA